jgi:ADP-ribosylglycohydrolase
MRYCALDRFKGAWLGSILGEALANHQYKSDRIKIIQYQPQEWLLLRNTIAEEIIKNKGLAAESSINIADNQLKNSVNSDHASLLLLPLIIFCADNIALFKDILTHNNLYLLKSPEAIEDVLIWGGAISLALKEKLGAEELNASSLIERVLIGVGVNNTSLIKKLKIVDRAWRRGSSFNELLEELSSFGNRSQTAIALSFYCFASTPEDFALAVKRAANTGNLALTTAALTGALSGAYNSLTGIPLYWNIFGNENQAYGEVMTTAKELFDTWSGIYSPQDHHVSSDAVFSAVASPLIIQTRTSLKIISQTE